MNYYSTLGYEYNPFLITARIHFLEQLQYIWKKHIGLPLPSDTFLYHPDNHVRLFGMRNLEPNLIQQHVGELHRAWLIYEQEGEGNKSGIRIARTNILLTLDFINPDINHETHPSHRKNQITPSLGLRTESEWSDLFSRSFQIIRNISPGWMDEIETVITQIIPFGVSVGTHNSGSYSNAIGHILLSYPEGIVDPESILVEAIIHEYNHNKINTVLHAETLLFDALDERYYSPYRPDPRHIHGIYLGLHALSGAFWLLMYGHVQGVHTLSEEIIKKACTYILKNGISVQILEKYAHMSSRGRMIFEEMKSVHSECLGFLRDAGISQTILEGAREQVRTHFQETQKMYPYILT